MTDRDIRNKAPLSAIGFARPLYETRHSAHFGFAGEIVGPRKAGGIANAISPLIEARQTVPSGEFPLQHAPECCSLVPLLLQPLLNGLEQLVVPVCVGRFNDLQGLNCSRQLALTV